MMSGLPDAMILLDLFVAGLLILVILYAVRLNKHLRALQSSKAELEELLQSFVGATTKAEDAIARVKEVASTNTGDLNKLVSQAEQLSEDLRFLVDRGEKIANRLDMEEVSRDTYGAASGTRAMTRPGASQPEPGRALAARAEDRTSVAGSDLQDDQGKKRSALLKALQGMR